MDNSTIIQISKRNHQLIIIFLVNYQISYYINVKLFPTCLFQRLSCQKFVFIILHSTLFTLNLILLLIPHCEKIHLIHNRRKYIQQILTNQNMTRCLQYSFQDLHKYNWSKDLKRTKTCLQNFKYKIDLTGFSLIKFWRHQAMFWATKNVQKHTLYQSALFFLSHLIASSPTTVYFKAMRCFLKFGWC